MKLRVFASLRLAIGRKPVKKIVCNIVVVPPQTMWWGWYYWGLLIFFFFPKEDFYKIESKHVFLVHRKPVLFVG